METPTQWHGSPSSVWESLHTNSVSGITHFLTFPLPPDAPWELSQWSIRRHLRAYASNHQLNSNDVDVSNITSYNTRVERLVKRGDKWHVKVRKLELLSRTRQLEVTWWTEVGIFELSIPIYLSHGFATSCQTFDAVVVAAATRNSPFVPNIRGLDLWASRHPAQVFHARRYRRPQKYINQTVLIVGASVCINVFLVRLHILIYLASRYQARKSHATSCQQPIFLAMSIYTLTSGSKSVYSADHYKCQGQQLNSWINPYEASIQPNPQGGY